MSELARKALELTFLTDCPNEQKLIISFAKQLDSEKPPEPTQETMVLSPRSIIDDGIDYSTFVPVGNKFKARGKKKCTKKKWAK